MPRIRFQRALTHCQAMILSRDMPQKVFWGPNAQIWLLGPSLLKLENFDFFVTIRISSPLCFQRALNHYQAMIFSRDMPKCQNVKKASSYSPQLHVA